MAIAKRAALNMMDSYTIEPGPTLADKLGARITEAWASWPAVPIVEDEDGAPLPEYIAALATALAVIRLAPAQPTAEQINEIAQEYNLL